MNGLKHYLVVVLFSADILLNAPEVYFVVMMLGIVSLSIFFYELLDSQLNWVVEFFKYIAGAIFLYLLVSTGFAVSLYALGFFNDVFAEILTKSLIEVPINLKIVGTIPSAFVLYNGYLAYSHKKSKSILPLPLEELQ